MAEKNGKLLIADGAWGTEIQRRGLPPGSLPESWNLTRPAEVENLARLYVQAGCDILLTNTFGANPFVLGRYGLGDRFEDINRKGAALSKAAAPENVKVFGSIGPTGLLPSVEDVDEKELYEGFLKQARFLAEGGVDGLVVETMSDIVEFKLALQAAVQTGLPVCGCMTFDSGPGKVHTMMGVSVEEAAQAAEEIGASMVGANCGAGIEHYRDVVQKYQAATKLPIWVKPNAGIPELHSGTIAYAMQPETFVRYARQLVDLGVHVIGGCCGTGPDLIRLLVRTFKAS